MNTMLHKYLALGGMLLGFAGFASASTSFDFTSQSLNPGSANSGGSLSMTEGSLTVTETAYWVNANNSGASVTGTTNDFQRTWLGAYNVGLGVCNPNEQSTCAQPQHQIDNLTGMDFILLSFNAVVDLADIKIANFGNPSGSGSEDVDLSYAVLTGTQFTNLTTTALSAVNFTTLNTGFASGTTPVTDAVSGVGQYFLIGAAVTANYGDTAGNATPDAFKIQSITVAPEPATFLLIGSGLMAGALIRRRKKA